jgi:hypothetical protein
MPSRKLFAGCFLAATAGGLSVFHQSVPSLAGVSDAIFIMGLTLMVIVAVRTIGFLIYGSFDDQLKDLHAQLAQRDQADAHDWESR